MGNLLTALPQSAIKYSYLHSDTDAFRRLYEKIYGLGSPSIFSEGALNISWMPFTKFLILNVTAMDIFYIIAVYRTMKKEGLNPWAFFNDKPAKDSGFTEVENATETIF